MDSNTEISGNPIESTTTDESTTNEEIKTTENSEIPEQNNVIDVIGNGQLVKKVRSNRVLITHNSQPTLTRLDLNQ